MITHYTTRDFQIVCKDEAEAMRLQVALKEAMQWFPKEPEEKPKNESKGDS